MKLYYFRDPLGNFGDDLNPWLWERLLPGFFDGVDEVLFIGIGTLLNHRIPSAKRRIVFGTGVGYGRLPQIDQSWDIVCVRGPRSAAALGLDADAAVTDPAIFIHDLFGHRVPKAHRFSFMPHCASARNGDWEEVCGLAGIHYIDPQRDVATVASDLAKTEVLLAEAMHGAIVADTFRIPWIPVRCYDHIEAFKWNDWTDSVALTYEPLTVPGVFRGEALLPPVVRMKTRIKRVLLRAGVWDGSWSKPVPARSPRRVIEAAASRLNYIAGSVEPSLSSDPLFRSRLERLYERLDLVRRRYALS